MLSWECTVEWSNLEATLAQVFIVGVEAEDVQAARLKAHALVKAKHGGATYIGQDPCVRTNDGYCKVDQYTPVSRLEGEE